MGKRVCLRLCVACDSGRVGASSCVSVVSDGGWVGASAYVCAVAVIVGF